MLPPNPSLVALVLIIKTRTGVHPVFHYPPNPGHERPHIKLDYENSFDEEFSDSSPDDGYSSVEDERPNNDRDATSTGHTGDGDIDESGSASPQKVDMIGWRRPDVSRDGFLGLPVGVHHFLCPASTAHMKRFEMSIDRRVFLGRPIFSRIDVVGQRKKRPRASKSAKNDVEAKSSLTGEMGDGKAYRTPVQLDDDLGETTGNDTDIEGQENTEWNDSQIEDDTEEQTEDQNMTAPKPREVLSMFHVVFVMNPPAFEYQLRVDEMYNHVVKKFTRALKWEQSRSNYVLNEARKIRELQAKRGTSSISHEVQGWN